MDTLSLNFNICNIYCKDGPIVVYTLYFHAQQTNSAITLKKQVMLSVKLNKLPTVVWDMIMITHII